MLEFDMVINGEPVQSGNTFEVINPATGKAFARCQLGDGDHVDQAVAAARAAFPAWSRTSDEERKQLLHAVAGAIEANMPELMQLVTKETGKPMGGLNGVGSGMEVGGSIAWRNTLPNCNYRLMLSRIMMWRVSKCTESHLALSPRLPRGTGRC